MSGVLDDLVDGLIGVPKEVIDAAVAATTDMVWIPNPGFQTAAYESEADELFCGGSAGPGKTDLGIGLGLNRHERSLLLRRFNDDAKSMAERAMNIISTRDGYNGQDQILRRPGGRRLQFGGCKDLEDRQRYKGDPNDLIHFDEITDFLEAQYRFIIAWNRSTTPRQRCRVVCTGNPPTTPEGLWVVKYWGAWLDPTHPKFGKVREGQLLWYTTIAGKDTEVDGPGPHFIEGEDKPVYARSRTFIRGWLSENPDLAKTDYDATLAALPEEMREAYRGGHFDRALEDKPFQMVPTAWVQSAMDRWTERPPVGVPQCALGIDCTGGGRDPMIIAPRHDGWFDKIVVIPGSDIPPEIAGRMAAGHVLTYRRDNAIMIVDMGGGYGGPLYEHLHSNFDANSPEREPLVKSFVGSAGTTRRTHDGHLTFNNCRTEALWRMREALDPGQPGGSPIFLHPDHELLQDLTAIAYKITRGTIHAEAKEIVCARLGRSTNKGDGTCMAWTAGPVASTDGAAWDSVRREMGLSGRLAGRRPQVIVGREHSHIRR